MEEQATIKDDLERIEKICADYEDKLYLGKIQLKESDYNISKDELLKMSSNQIYGVCYEMAQYLLGLQKEINKLASKLNWAEHQLNRLLEKEAKNYRAFTWQEKKAEALNNNSAAQKLDKTRTQFKMEIDRLSYIPQKLQYQIDFASQIAFGKRKYENAQG